MAEAVKISRIASKKTVTKPAAGVNKEEDDDGVVIKAGNRLKVKRLSRPLGSGYVSAEHKELANKKRRQLVGVTVLVVSSTLLLINVAAFLMFPNKLEDLWLNVYVIGFNLESALSNVGILFVCGIGSKRVAPSTHTNAPKVAVAPGSYVANASSVYHPSEIEVEPTDQKPGFNCSLSKAQGHNHSQSKDSSSQAAKDSS
jgi:hypothetical protein